jgi:hypothetical protein
MFFLIKAGIAQLVEHNLAKVGVAGSSPVSRSGRRDANAGRVQVPQSVQQDLSTQDEESRAVSSVG